MPSWVHNLFTNWREYDAPVLTKLLLGMRNSVLRLRMRPCCGHHGEPGC